MLLSELRTPCALVDLERLEANAAMMRQRALELGVALRPHVKTHKVPALARLQHGGLRGPVTVSTLAEARAFAADGFADILWALPLPAGREEEALALPRLGLLVDSLEAAARLGAAAEATGSRARVHIKVDCGYGRSGVDPEGELALALAERIHAHPRLELAGLLTHGGHAYSAPNPQAIAAVAEQERAAVVGLADRIEAAGIPRPRTSVGSTPTVMQAAHYRGVDEIRPGNYAFFDAFQASIGSCRPEQVAFSVLCTIVGRYPERDTLVIDAGALALSVDPGARHLDPEPDYGPLHDIAGLVRHPELRLQALSQEHGKIRVVGGLRGDAFPLGSRLRVLPNHSCLAAACHRRYHLLRGDRVIERVEPVRGW
jgi:D-serine deaminase-like pyridoxal phosphate-dependent protein